MAAESKKSGPSSSSNKESEYDVFLSFSGKDTRNNFISHLHRALDQVGIQTFIDDDGIPRGSDLSSTLIRAIEKSRISIVVFSRNYANSNWCLDELVKIMDCNRTMGQVVLPVFYEVDPSVVRHQTGSFGTAFSKHEERFGYEKVKMWRAALTEAANLSGYDSKGKESDFIQEIVQFVLEKIVRPSYFNVEENLVGIISRVKHIIPSLSFGTDEKVRIIGIYGIGGVGKTTIAKAIYNQNFHLFEGSCFLANVAQVSKEKNGIVCLQEKLLYEILKKKFKVASVDHGVSIMMARFRWKKVFIVLDDLDDYLSQVKSLAGNRNWFGPGSRIIITRRNMRLLDEVVVDESCEIKGLNYNESLELLIWHAFRTTIPPPADYEDHLKAFVTYTGGLPLALKILGSHLFKRSKVEWRSALEKLREIPDEKIMEILEISFDALGDTDKDMFLDIACFFVGMDMDEAIEILDACGFYAYSRFIHLKERCLLSIDETN